MVFGFRVQFSNSLGLQNIWILSPISNLLGYMTDTQYLSVPE